MSKPDLIAINHDDYSARYVGRTADGGQFFLTTPFVPAMGGSAGREFVALYLFDSQGRFREARIDDLGTRAELEAGRARRTFEQRLAELGEIEYGCIEVEPFQVERFGTTFGLLPSSPEDDEGVRHFTVEPGDYMAFFEPFDSGEYDT